VIFEISMKSWIESLIIQLKNFHGKLTCVPSQQSFFKN
jgi:hypothetical protein